MNSYEFKAVIGADEYTYSDIVSATITRSAFEKMSIGGAPSSTLEMVFVPKGTIPTAAQIKCYYRESSVSDAVVVVDENSNVVKTDDNYVLASQHPTSGTWSNFGTFYIDTRSKDAFGVMKIVAYDSMMMAEQIYTDSTGAYPMLASGIVQHVASAIGISVANISALPSVSIPYPGDIYTMREALFFVGAACGGNFVMDADNKLQFISIEGADGSTSYPCASFDLLSNESITVSRVSLIVDNNVQYTAGTDDGYELVSNCPIATQSMADNALAIVSGKTYLPFSASGIVAPPSLKLGDGIVLNGTSVKLYQISTQIGPGMICDASAPIDTEVNHEYPYQTKSVAERQLAASYAKIEKSVDSLTIEVGGKLDGEDAQAMIDTSLDGITLSASAGTNSSTISIKSGSITLDSEVVEIGRIDASLIDVDNINADNITAGELSADHIKLGGDMSVYQSLSSSSVGGYIGYGQSDYTSGGGIHMVSDNGNSEVIATDTGSRMSFMGSTNNSSVYASNNGAVMECNGNSQAICTNNGAKITYTGGARESTVYAANNGAVLECDGVTVTQDGTGLYPSSQISLGASSQKWSAVYAVNGTIQTSDARQKHHIDYDVQKYYNVFDNLKPCTFALNGSDGKEHIGLIAQDVEAASVAAGMDPQNMAAIYKDEDGNYGLAYSEFIALCISKIQSLEKRIKELEEKNG